MSVHKRSGLQRRGLAWLSAVGLILAAVGIATAFGAFESGTRQSAPLSARGDRITVHGAWTIQVRRPDGRVVSTRRFHNALVQLGSETLVKLLGRQVVPGLWSVVVNGTPTPWPSPGCGEGTIYEPSSSVGTSTCVFKNLAVSTPSSGPDAGKLVLQGRATAEVDAAIDRVLTTLERCPTTVAPGTECLPNRVFFSSTTLSPAISVTSGQDVLVTVRFTFS